MTNDIKYFLKVKHSNQADKLSSADIAFLPTLATYLRKLKGIGNAKTNRQIQAAFPKQFTGISRGKLTAMIHEIRIRGMVKNLIGSPAGFYITRDKDRVVEYVQTLHSHIVSRKKSAASFGQDPGKGLKKRYKVKGFTNSRGKYIKPYYRTYPGFKQAEQLSVDFTTQVQPNRRNKHKDQLKLF